MIQWNCNKKYKKILLLANLPFQKDSIGRLSGYRADTRIPLIPLLLSYPLVLVIRSSVRPVKWISPVPTALRATKRTPLPDDKFSGREAPRGKQVSMTLTFSTPVVRLHRQTARGAAARTCLYMCGSARERFDLSRGPTKYKVNKD